MKRMLSSIFALAFAAMILAAPVAAQTSQGLRWGIAVNDQFNFNMNISGAEMDESVSEGIYMEVTSRPTIPNVLTAWNQLPTLGVGFYWTNETSMGFSVLIFMFLGFSTGKIAVPTGNYTLLSELLEDWLDDPDIDYTPIVTGLFWGVTAEAESGGEEMAVTVTYLKEDGFLARYLVTSKNSTHTLWDMSIVRLNLPSEGIMDLIMDNILYIGIGVVVLIVLVAVCKKK